MNTSESGKPNAEYRVGKAIVRMHGTPNRENLEAATLKFLNAVECQRRKKKEVAKQ